VEGYLKQIEKIRKKIATSILMQYVNVDSKQKASMKIMTGRSKRTFLIFLNANNPIQISPLTIHCSKKI
jgi:hypothetical protein